MIHACVPAENLGQRHMQATTTATTIIQGQQQHLKQPETVICHVPPFSRFRPIPDVGAGLLPKTNLPFAAIILSCNIDMICI